MDSGDEVLSMNKHENIYQTANHLAELLRACPEYNQYLDAKERLLNDPINRQVLQDIRRKQFNLQEICQNDDELQKQENFINDMMMSVAMNPVVNDFLNAEYNFGRIIEQLSMIFEQIFPYDPMMEGEEEIVEANDAPPEKSAPPEPTYIN